ncbi:MAG: signal peptidase II, partial [bacterium]|nr:signal peptidase II [bacterium]
GQYLHLMQNQAAKNGLRLMFKDFKKMIAVSSAVIFFIALDRFLKVFALSDPGSARNLLGDFLRFNFKANYYIAFSLPLAGQWLNIVICLIILSLIFYLARAWRSGKQEIAVCLFITVVGAASNLYDRLKYGFVIDYLDLKYFTVLNLADVMIVAGVFLLLVILNKKEAA